MDFFKRIDFVAGMKTLIGVLALSIPYLDEQLVIGGYIFDAPDSLVALLSTQEAVTIASGLVMYGVGMKIVRAVRKLYPKK